MATTIAPLTRTLDHLPPEVQEMVRAVARAVVEAAPVEMLILFGSFARGTFQDDQETGYKSDLDLLAVADDEKTANDVGLWNAAAERAQPIAGEVRVDLIVHDRRYLNDQIRLGAYFFVDILREGVLLHDSRRFQLAQPKALTRPEMLELGQQNFAYWFESANVFFNQSRELTAQAHRAEAAFMLHQAAERYSHALLLVFTAYKPKTHDLTDLGERIERLAPSVAGALPRDGTEQDKHLFDLLRKAYIEARYKKTYRITEEELRELQGRVRELAGRIRGACIERLEGVCGKEAVRGDLPGVGDVNAVDQGELRGLARAVLAVLEGRGIAVSDEVRGRILGCREEAVLVEWLRRAGVVQRGEALVGE